MPLLQGLSLQESTEIIQLIKYPPVLFNLSHFPKGCVPLFSSFLVMSKILVACVAKSGRGNVPVARNRTIPTRNRTKRQNQAIRKNSTIPQSNFYSSWGPTPEVPPLKFRQRELSAFVFETRIPSPASQGGDYLGALFGVFGFGNESLVLKNVQLA